MDKKNLFCYVTVLVVGVFSFSGLALAEEADIIFTNKVRRIGIFLQVGGNRLGYLLFAETLREEQSTALLMKIRLRRVNVIINKTR